jgi:hypothetical protein
MPVATLKKITAWAQAGGKVIAIGKLPTITPEGKPLASSDTAALPLIANAGMLEQALHNAAAPDFKLSAGDDAARTELGFIRRKMANADIYFVANTSNQPIDATVSFGTKYKNAIAVDADAATVWEASAEGQAIHLAPYESRVFFFSENPVHPGGMLPSGAAATADEKQIADLSSDWKVDFVGDKKVETEATLKDWLDDPATKSYSGEAVYSKEFDLPSRPAAAVYLAVDGGSPEAGAPNSPPEHAPAGGSPMGPDGMPNPQVTRTGPGMHAYYNPPVREAALVTINGQAAGALWHPPYRLDVSKFLKAGQNRIEIHVYNTALNHWAALPPHDYGPLIAKYGDKFQVQDLQLVKPVPSGLLGTIHLVTESK